MKTDEQQLFLQAMDNGCNAISDNKDLYNVLKAYICSRLIDGKCECIYINQDLYTSKWSQKLTDDVFNLLITTGHRVEMLYSTVMRLGTNEFHAVGKYFDFRGKIATLIIDCVGDLSTYKASCFDNCSIVTFKEINKL